MADWVVAACGPSLVSPDLEAVRGRAKLCVVNNAVELAPWADVLYASDHTWWRKYHDRVRDFTGRLITCNHSASVLPQIDRIERLRHRTGWWFTDDLPFCTGRNSGHAAITMLRAVFGARRFALLGFDYQRTDGMAHFFGSHEGLTNPTAFSGWQEDIDRLAASCKAHGVEIVNCSRQTAITSLPRQTIGDWLARTADDSPAPALSA